MYYACRLHYTRDPINTLMRATIYIFYIMFFLQSVLTKERSNKLLFYSFFINNIFKHNSPNNIYIFKKKYKTFSTNNSINKMWDNKNPFIAVYVTTPSKEIAESISNILLNEKLASCINIIPGVLSLYHWKGEIAKDNEFLMMIKTKKHLFGQIVKTVKSNHPYEVPEVISVPIHQGSNDYLNWISDSVKPDEIDGKK
ncbi:cutA, putative [Plasmodium berghei]|uniref:Protein CutA, putative n=2 Tax=Plasmodium berghei TaxID=5821 RepID=A0A509AW39_PLABA|nr:protein CutA, putative [Plasmodium berghei ANKA]CXJ29339.1 cutA, putative [Plasmodium berghei]SCM27079.1 cutA, putative [Plasmodium berghei]SCN28805.1 cutA, putative [Plasmodium berghei]SCO64552.1 cutA, putative [Plasmodium berghei]VUC58688.1 protein CutA, putative [Plasmodium berghei ANKA]|eukprot:XP_034424451.1 protein CutA, putative [Plasmodium berghei ANKA]